jgi:PAS domain S-box-containing protein
VTNLPAQPKKRLATKLTTSFVLLATFLMLGTVPVSTYVALMEQKQALRRAEQATAEKVALNAPQFITNLVAELSHDAGLYRLAELEGEAQKTALMALLDSYDRAHQMEIFSLERAKIAEAVRYRVTPSAYDSVLAQAERERFKALQGDSYTSQVYIGVESNNSTNEPYMLIALPLVRNGKIVSMLSVNFNLSHIWEIVAKTKLGQSGYVYIVDQAGHVIAHPDQKVVLKQTEVEDLPEPVQAALKGSGVLIQREYRGLSQKQVVGAIIPVEDLGWWVIVELPTAEAYASIRIILTMSVVLLVLGIGIAFLVGRYLSAQIVRPIQDLEQGAERVGGGDLSHVIQVQTDDEIGVLAQSFNSMADRLRSLVGGLEQTVQQRTAELAQSMTRTQDTLAYLSAVINNIADGLLVTDLQGTIIQVNPAFLGMFNLGDSELVEQHCRSLLGDALADLAAQTRNNPNSIFTAELALPMNRVGKAVATGIMKDTDPTKPEIQSELIGSVILIRDITADKEVDKMKTDFISTVSHELRTPLTSVLGFAKIIKKKLDDTVFPLVQTDDKKIQRTVRQVGDNLEIILAEGERLTTLINDVLDIAKMEAGKIDWKMEPLQLSEVLDHSLLATSALFDHKGLKAIQDVQPNLPDVIGDRDRLIQVVINLLSNAVKFTDRGAITCAIHHVGNAIKVSIADQGIGIAAEDLPKVFEKFKQVGDTLTDKPKGTGLGLPICKQIVEHHGGQIWAESQLGVGTTFSFTIPIVPVAEVEARKIDLDALISQLRDHVSAQSDVLSDRKKTVLVIDDDLSIRELLRQQLEAEGYVVWEAKDGRDGITQVKQALPDLIILDVMMPEMSGFDVAAVLKNDPKTMGIPIIINSIVEDKARGYRLGVDRYLTKPADSEELLREVSSLLSQGTSTKKIMVVDENASTVKTLSEVLQARGYSVVEASNDRELIERAVAAKPDMIIVNADFSEKHNVIKTLRFEKGLENVLFLLLADEKTDGSS